MGDVVVGVIGGTSLYQIDGLEETEEVTLETPFGKPSDAVLTGRLGDTKLVFVPRHGRGHILTPSEVNYRANIFALKKLGVSWCIAVNAVGSLKEEFRPGDVVIPDQIVDRTRGRANTFFGRGIAAHVNFADPFCSVLGAQLKSAVASADSSVVVHSGGTYVCIEGPAFSTRAESQLYRSWGCDIIGMTAIPEAKLAREAGISYATLALVTDYDCWRTSDSDVDVTDILRILQQNSALACKVVACVAPQLASMQVPDQISQSLSAAILTQPDLIPEKTREELAPIVSNALSSM